MSMHWIFSRYRFILLNFLSHFAIVLCLVLYVFFYFGRAEGIYTFLESLLCVYRCNSNAAIASDVNVCCGFAYVFVRCNRNNTFHLNWSAAAIVAALCVCVCVSQATGFTYSFSFRIYVLVCTNGHVYFWNIHILISNVPRIFFSFMVYRGRHSEHSKNFSNI